MQSDAPWIESPYLSIEDLPVGIARQDTSGKQPGQFNHVFLQMFGWEFHEIDTIEKWFQIAYPEEEHRQKVIALWQSIKIDTDKQESAYSEKVKVKIACKDGTFKWCEVRYQRKEAFIYCVFIDISAYHKSDHKLRSTYKKLNRIRQGIQCEEFELYYQPKVDLYKGKVVGVEALIRWNHPEQGVLPPSEFLSAMHNQDESILLGEYVLHKALQQIVDWNSCGIDLTVSVNIDGYHLLRNDFSERLKSILSQYPKAAPEQIELEIIETSALKDIDRVSGIMHECQTLGLTFAIDDFGTGYSSLTYLKQFPAQTLKIDKSFVIDMLDDTDDLAILDSVIGLSNVFGRQIVAEGVESILHGEILLRMGCRVAQGYVIAKPMPAEKFENWLLQEWKPFPELLGMESLNREKISVLYATIEHRVWVNQLISYLQGHSNCPPTSGKEPHQFSHWLEQNASEEIYKMHDRIHQLSDEIIEQHEMENRPDPQNIVPDLILLRDTLVRSILDTLNCH